MTVYVDTLVYVNYVYVNGVRLLWHRRNILRCHLFADDVSELHVFAKRLGLRRDWFKDDARLPHYDVTENKRRKAVRLGAVEVDWKVTYEHIKRNREKAGGEPKGKGS